MEKTVGMRIRECRMKMGMTQEELAVRMCTKKSTISAYELDKIDIKVSILCEGAKVLGGSVGYLVGEETEIMNEEVAQAVRLLQNIKNDELRRMAIGQLKFIETTDKALC